MQMTCCGLQLFGRTYFIFAAGLATGIVAMSMLSIFRCGQTQSNQLTATVSSSHIIGTKEGTIVVRLSVDVTVPKSQNVIINPWEAQPATFAKPDGTYFYTHTLASI